MEAPISSSSFFQRNPQSFTTKINIYVKGNKLPFTSKPAPLRASINTNKTRFSSLLNNTLNRLDELICAFLDRPLTPGNDPINALGEKSKPLGREIPPITCPVVEGTLPPCLDGAYIRNGPNPQFTPKGPYNMLDGDGMLHMIRITRGKATFCSRYIRTHKFKMESELGYPVVPNMIASFINGPAASIARMMVFAARVLIARQFDPLGHGFGVANTNIALLAGGRRLFALCESDLPYEIKVTEDGDIATLRRHCFHSVDLSFIRMTAHPKVDQETGEAFAYRYNVRRPFLTFHRIDREGRKQKDVPIFSKRDCTVVHDFGVTESHAVFPDLQLVINPMWIFARGQGSVVGTDNGKIPRLGIIRRCAEEESEMQWVEASGFNMMHCVNAWDEVGGESIVMVAMNAVKVEHVVGQPELSEVTLEKVTIDIKAKRVRRQPLSVAGRFHEFGTINPAYAGKKIRYVYAGVIASKSMAIVGVEKFDLSLVTEELDGSDCTVASRLYGLGCYAGESVFVAKDPNNPRAEEDDGYLITYANDDNTGESRFLVMDAKSPELDIIAAVKLPQRLPNGLHSLFLSETDLNKLSK